ncbi:MAG: hypothetical protein GY845_04795 [Planctomycetes bacterium]|nr:hypothetical protein [Planctomycetota bacterium]
MSMKTATLIALIGIIVHFCIGNLYMFVAAHVYRISPLLGRAVYMFSSMVLHGSIILFLAVFYSKQKE